MPDLNLLVISPKDAPHLSVLSKLPQSTRVVIADDPETLVAAAADADVVLNCTGRGEPLRTIWGSAGRLQWVHSLAAGVESQLIPEIVESDIPLTNSRGVYKESLGEFAIAAALFFAKDLRRMLRSQEKRLWDPFDVEMLSRQTMGIAGYGEIGKAVARRARAFGMKIFAMRRKPPQDDGLVDRWFRLDERVEMARECDYLCVTAPLTKETRGLIGEAEIAAMKPGGVLINLGRGPVIDEEAMVRALRERRIRGAALDVFDIEPLPQDHPLWQMDNVLISPHCADHIEGWLEASVEFFVENFRRFSAGEPLLNIVDKRAGY